MKWIRANIRLGSPLAIVALVVQILVSFGHFHGVDARSDQARLRNLLLANPGYGSDLSPTSDLSSVRPLPASHHNPDQQPDDQCAICAVMAMAHALVVSTPPVLLLPKAFGLFYRTTVAGFIRSNSGCVAFQPRAPPVG